MARNHLFTARVWQHRHVRHIRHAFSIERVYRLLTASQRRLPDYIVAGAQKSGTTSLWAYLNEHPLVEPAMLKETHYFDNEFRRPEAWYRMHFPLQRSRRSGDPQRTLTGESTAYYMFHPLAPQRIAAMLPNVKLIFVLRNPVERAFSHYQLKLRRRQESLSFEQAIETESERLAGEEEKLIADPTNYSARHDRYSYLARGRYLEQIMRWQAIFPAKQLLIVESSELFRNTSEVYQRVLKFLNLPAFTPPRFGNRFPGKYDDRMLDATRRKLTDYFAPYNERLYSHLGQRFNWEDFAKARKAA